jgi:protein tyrosine phosphatase
MIKIQKSKTADTRSCDFSQVTEMQLLASSLQHINDVNLGMEFMKDLLSEAAERHDYDKLTGIKQFHADFITGFKQTGWWDNHRKVNRHHLLQEDGIPADVNLVDVLDMIVDCVMAGMGRTGTVYPLGIKPEVLMKTFQNTVELLKQQIVVEEDTPYQN